MNRASPAELRRALEVANVFAKSGIPFVCVPYLSDDEKSELVDRVNNTLKTAEQQAAKKGGA